MNNNNQKQSDTTEIKSAVSTVVEKGENIREQVRNITLNALSEKHLDLKEIKQVIHNVIQGASSGVTGNQTQVKEALTEAVSGVDEALEKSAEASKLAIEEAASKVKDFGKHDLTRAVDDIVILEELFLDTIKEVAEGTNQLAQDNLHDFLQHAKIQFN